MKSKSFAIYNWNATNTCLIALGVKNQFVVSDEVQLNEIDLFLDEHKNNYIFTVLTYDLKNKIENVESKNESKIVFPDALFWTAELVVSYENKQIKIVEGEYTEENKRILDEILLNLNHKNDDLPKLTFNNNLSKQNYLAKIQNIQNEIQFGNAYEINFCQEYFVENCPNFSSISLYNKLFNLTKAPFSCYLNLEEIEVFCASPERFIQKKGTTLRSQPIKGTRARGKTKEEDEILKEDLLQDKKEIAENVMITDLVRNDLAKVAQKNSVKVEELCALYSFNTVHQLISTISCQVKEDVTFSDILKASFPMGSMTGAPKISSMEIIEREENFKRGIYSGSIGYIEPNGDFDLNVVIRSFVLDKKSRNLTCGVGGAITKKSIPEKEYEECITKVGKLIQLFGDANFE